MSDKQRLDEIAQRLANTAYFGNKPERRTQAAADVAWLLLRLEDANEEANTLHHHRQQYRKAVKHHRDTLRKVWRAMTPEYDMTIEGIMRDEEPWLAKEMDNR